MDEILDGEAADDDAEGVSGMQRLAGIRDHEGVIPELVAPRAGDQFTSNMLRAGELFVLTLWLQSQMGDLLIFRNHPVLLDGFHATPARVPDAVHALRLPNWENDFTPIKSAFIEAFSTVLTPQDVQDLEYVAAIRNAIGHSHVSIGRDYFLYRPRQRSEQVALEALRPRTVEGQSDPIVVKLAFYRDEEYLRTFAIIKRLDEDCFKRVSDVVGVEHRRIR